VNDPSTLVSRQQAPDLLEKETTEPARVLVVDDDERNLLAIQTVLEDIGEVVLARSGEEALRHLLKAEFAVILLDVFMPGIDGYETARLVRQREQSKGIPIVFLSAVNKEMEHLLRGYSMGAVDYVFKPVDPLVLRSKVSVFVDLFDKSKEIERKARHEQALLDANLQANAELLRTEQELRRAERQLVQAQKMDAIGKLTGGIAHDFNNLLGAVIGGLGLIERRGALTEEQRRVLEMTRRAAEQGAELVRRLLAFARRQKLEPASVDIDALSAATSDLLAHTLGGMVEIEWRKSKDVWCAFADQAQLELALLNLIINARDAMTGAGTVVVSVKNCSLADEEVPGLGEGDYVRIAVTDNGGGIPADLIDKVMEPFFTTKEAGKGTGLGLSMVYGFAKQSDGAFRLKSKVGRGTTAELWLPRAPEGSMSQERRKPAKAAEAFDRPLRILLVDDHEELRTTTAAMLADLGHIVEDVPSGAAALESLRDDSVACDLLISDYAMPKLSGTELIREARQSRSGLPALIITGYADADALGDSADGLAVLFKPFTHSELSAAVGAAVLNGSSSQAAD